MNIIAGKDFYQQFANSVSGLVENAQWFLFDSGRHCVPPTGRESIAILAGDSYGSEFKAYLQTVPNLKWLHTEDSGVSEPFYRDLMDKGVLVTRSVSANAPEVAEFVFAMVLWSAKRLGELNDQHRQAQWRLLPLESLGDKTILVVGLGAVGQRVARIARSFGMKVLGVRKTPVDAADVDETGTPERLVDFLPLADYVVLAVPLTPETRNLIGRHELDLLRETATLINIARGEILDIDALKGVLESGKYRQVCLDVLPQEPWPGDDELWACENVFITPHNAFMSPLYQPRVAKIWRENLKRYLSGRPLIQQVLTDD
jgi:phosphoglycerate dehydrogenase-like enzyme